MLDTVQVQRGTNLLIRGRSGIGKSSLIKAIAGLWPYTQKGTIKILSPSVMFLPQDAYCFYGTLLEQVGWLVDIGSFEKKARGQEYIYYTSIRMRATNCLLMPGACSY